MLALEPANMLLGVKLEPDPLDQIKLGFEENDARGEARGVLHLPDRFLAPLLRKLQQAPVMQQPEMQPILVDGGEFVAQALVEIFDDLCVALHDASRCRGAIKMALVK